MQCVWEGRAICAGELCVLFFFAAIRVDFIKLICWFWSREYQFSILTLHSPSFWGVLNVQKTHRSWDTLFSFQESSSSPINWWSSKSSQSIHGNDLYDDLMEICLAGSRAKGRQWRNVDRWNLEQESPGVRPFPLSDLVIQRTLLCMWIVYSRDTTSAMAERPAFFPDFVLLDMSVTFESWVRDG